MQAHPPRWVFWFRFALTALGVASLFAGLSALVWAFWWVPGRHDALEGAAAFIIAVLCFLYFLLVGVPSLVVWLGLRRGRPWAAFVAIAEDALVVLGVFALMCSAWGVVRSGFYHAVHLYSAAILVAVATPSAAEAIALVRWLKASAESQAE